MPFMVKCFECGNCLGDIREAYIAAVDGFLSTKTQYGVMDNLNPDDSKALGFILDEFEITRDCCRTHLLTKVDPLKCI